MEAQSHDNKPELPPQEGSVPDRRELAIPIAEAIDRAGIAAASCLSLRRFAADSALS